MPVDCFIYLLGPSLERRLTRANLSGFQQRVKFIVVLLHSVRCRGRITPCPALRAHSCTRAKRLAERRSSRMRNRRRRG